MEHEVTLIEMLETREARVSRQTELLARFSRPVISFSMNIAGPVKDTPLIRRGFEEGIRQLDAALRAARLTVLAREIKRAPTGCEALYAADASAGELKRICASIEDANALGRLFDMDVIGTDGVKLDREIVNGAARRCIVCGAAGKGCASRRVHGVPELQAATAGILNAHFREADRKRAAALATRALLDEVCTTPKPGLVDRNGNGSHDDMDIFTFSSSAAALAPYWYECFGLGQDTKEDAPDTVFRVLRGKGLAAEREMFLATDGINTHKGAIFTMGIVLCAAGRCGHDADAAAIAETCAELTRNAMHEDLEAMRVSEARTAGQRLFRAHGMTGARGEAAEGLPHVIGTALPIFSEALKHGLSRNDAGAVTLLHLIAAMTDTNMVSRGGRDAAEEASQTVRVLLKEKPFPPMEDITRLDALFTRERLSPGGCADLLAVAYFLYDWTQRTSESV